MKPPTDPDEFAEWCQTHRTRCHRCFDLEQFCRCPKVLHYPQAIDVTSREVHPIGPPR